MPAYFTQQRLAGVRSAGIFAAHYYHGLIGLSWDRNKRLFP